MRCKTNEFATNKGGMIKAPKPVTGQPTADVQKGKDLRSAKDKSGK